jgi:hypothetical protein
MGNLTLVTDKLNPALSNGPWAKKIEAILDHSALALNRPLRKYPEWSEATILARGEKLFETAVRIWPRPKQAVGA